MQKKVAAATLGCKVNMYDTQGMLELFEQSGYEITDFDKNADIYIINTCTVTNLGDRKSRQMVRRARKTNPDAIIAAVGCYAQVAPEEVSKIEGVNLVLGTKDRSQIVRLIEQYDSERKNITNVSDIFSETEFEALSVSALNDRRRAFLKIQEGCDRFCSYCIIPYARGRVRSKRPEDIMQEVELLAENGYKEIVLAGIHVASYGKDLSAGLNLLDVIEMVHSVEGIERIRTSSIEPAFVDDAFARRLGRLDKICDHFHMSLQSGSNNTLARMNRRYTKEQYKKAAESLRAVFRDAALTSDVIVGFPGETDEDFLESYEFIKEVGLAQLHVFKYSPKQGTPAAVFKNQIDNEIKTKRSDMLISLSDELNYNFMGKFINKEVSVLFERKLDENTFEGHSTNYIPVKVKSNDDLVNKILPVKIHKIEGDTCIGLDVCI